METKDIILELRTKKGYSQDELAEKLFVTRQAVSRWENGETIPNTETLKLLSKLFDVSINSACWVTVRRTVIASKPEKQALSWLKIALCVILSPAHYLMSSSFRPEGRTKVQGFL